MLSPSQFETRPEPFRLGYEDGYAAKGMRAEYQKTAAPGHGRERFSYCQGYLVGVNERIVDERAKAHARCDHAWSKTEFWLIDRCTKCGEERA